MAVNERKAPSFTYTAWKLDTLLRAPLQRGREDRANENSVQGQLVQLLHSGLNTGKDRGRRTSSRDRHIQEL